MSNYIELGAGYLAEPRGTHEYAIKHPKGGLGMADVVEVAMIESISRLQSANRELAEALRKIAAIGTEDGLSCDEYRQRLIASVGYARTARHTSAQQPPEVPMKK